MGGPDSDVARLIVLGNIRIELAGQVTEVRGAKVATLLGLLAVHRERPASEDLLIDELWSQQPPAAAQSAFRTYLANVRALLGRHRLLSGTTGHRLHPELVTLDIDEVFRAYGARSDTDPVQREAVLRSLHAQLLGAPFGGADLIAPIEQETRVLEELREAIHVDWLRSRFELGEGPTLIADLRRAVGDNCEHEGRVRLLMEALVRSGDRRGALRSYRELEAVLRESGLRPGAEIAAYELSIVTGSDRVATTPAPLHLTAEADATTGCFVGRDAQLAELSDPTRAIATVVGEPGSGKTALAAHLANELASAGRRVAYGSCLASDEPLAALRAAFPALRGLDAADESVIADAIVRWAQAAPPACLIVDDYDRADGRTAVVIERLVRKTDARNLLVRLFERPSDDARRRGAHAIVTDTGPRIVLDVLDRDEIDALLRVRLGRDAPRADADAVEQLSGGHAMVVAALADHLASGGSLNDVAAAATLTAALDVAFHGHDEEGRRVLGAIAHIDDSHVSAAHLAQWLELPIQRVNSVLDAARRTGLLLLGTELRFRNRLVGERASMLLDDASRAALDRAAAQDEHLPAWIRARAALRTATAATWAAAIAEAADACERAIGAHQPRHALDLVNAVLDAGLTRPVEPSVRLRLLRSAAQGYDVLGETERAAEVRREAFDEAERSGRLSDAIEIAINGPDSGRSVVPGTGTSLLGRCHAMLAGDVDPMLATRLLAELTFTALFQLDPNASKVEGWLADLLRRVDDQHDATTTAMVHRALYLAAISCLHDGDPAAHAVAMLANSGPSSSNDHQSLALIYAVRSAIASGTRADVLDALGQHRGFAAVSGRPADAWANDVMAATVAQLQGQPIDARHRARAALEFGLDHACGDALLSWELHLMSTVALRGHVTDPADESDARRYPLIGPLLFDARSPDAGDSTDLNGITSAILVRPTDIATLPTLAWLVEPIWTRERCDLAEAVLHGFNGACRERFIVVGHLPVGTVGPSDRIRAMLTHLSRGAAAADEVHALFDAAVECCDVLGAHAWAARTRIDQAVVFRASRHAADEQRCLAEAGARAALGELRSRERAAARGQR